MTTFTRDELAAALGDAAYGLKLVMIEAIPDDADQPISSYHLDLEDGLSSQFKSNLAKSVASWPNNDEWDPYEEGWVPEEGQFAVAQREVLDGSRLIEAINRGLEPGRVHQPQVGDPDLPRSRGYALLLTPRDNEDPSERIYLVRRRDPVQHLDRGRLTAFWSQSRLTLAHAVVGFDAQIDVAVWRDTVLIRSLAAFEALFFPQAVRADAAEDAVNKLNARLPISNLDVLVATARDDSLFAARLRRLARRPRFKELTLDAVRPGLRRFGLEHRFVTGGELVFDRARRWRWPFLAALEDGLVESPASGNLYQSTSQRQWQRRRVTGAIRENGVITALCGDGWGPTVLSDVATEIENALATYHTGTRDEPIEVIPSVAGDVLSLTATAADGSDSLSSLPDCDS
ncbi:MAG TPA: hypothetical protein VJ850_08500 [Candidatus Limnocylindrales bacterium]|nr:hypothetical protein [Candidatus Limnocylindrales bacterium]